MLVEVGGADDEERLVAGVRVAVVLAEDIAGRRLGDAAGPFRDGARGIARPLPPERGEVAAEPRDLVSRDISRGGRGEDAPEDERGAESKRGCFRDIHDVHGLGISERVLDGGGDEIAIAQLVAIACVPRVAEIGLPAAEIVGAHSQGERGPAVHEGAAG